MAKHLNVATIIDKNKIDSDNSFLLLLDILVYDNNNNYVETIKVVKNSENITFKGQTYTAAAFDFKMQMEANQEPSVSLTIQDQTRSLSQFVEAFAGMTNSKVVIRVINTVDMTAEPEMEEEFKVVHMGVDNYVVSATLGVDSVVAQRFPLARQFKDRCYKTYKGPRCKYAGPLATCSYTRFGPNGCIAHDNEQNFGGFPGISELM